MHYPATRLAGGIYGLLIGDALGVPYEFNGPTLIPPIAEIDFEPPRVSSGRIWARRRARGPMMAR